MTKSQKLENQIDGLKRIVDLHAALTSVVERLILLEQQSYKNNQRVEVISNLYQLQDEFHEIRMLIVQQLDGNSILEERMRKCMVSLGYLMDDSHHDALFRYSQN